jgi:hypothetical protein
MTVGANVKYNIFGYDFLGMDILWMTGAVGYFLAFLIFLRVKEDVKKQDFGRSMQATYHTAISGMKYVINHKILRTVFIAATLTSISLMLFAQQTHHVFLQKIGLDAQGIATIVAISSILGAIFALSHKIIKMSNKMFFILTIIIQLSLLAGLFFFNTSVAFCYVFFFLYYNVFSLRQPWLETFKQSFMTDKLRATIGSVDGILYNICGAIVFPLAGFLVDKIGVNNTILMGAIPLEVALGLFLKIKSD